MPQAGETDEIDQQVLEAARATIDEVGGSLENTRFKLAIGQAFGLAQEANRYLDAKAPWRAIREDREEASHTLNVSLRVLNCLKVVLAPFLPFSSQKVHEYLGFDGPVEQEPWDYESLVGAINGGATLRQPSPLYTKLDPDVVEQETGRLGVSED